MKKFAALFATVAFAAALFAATSLQSTTLGTGSIAGTITDSVTNAPVAGARVMAGCHLMATTGDDGTYIIENLAAGDYTVKAMKCGVYVTKAYPGPVHVEEGQAVTGIDIALAPIGGGGGGEGSISGTVIDATTNEPIVGAKVTAGGCRQYAMTGEDGTYTIADLADGTYTVKAMKCGYQCATYPDPVVIEGGAAVTGIDFALEPRSIQAVD